MSGQAEVEALAAAERAQTVRLSGDVWALRPYCSEHPEGCPRPDDGGAGAPPPAPAPLVTGAIGRGLVDAADAGISEAYARYLARLAELGAAAGDPGPGD